VPVKKVITILGTAFAVFFVFSAPADAAAMVEQTAQLAWGLVSKAANSLQTFVTTLIR
jgi:hypothetical protein